MPSWTTAADSRMPASTATGVCRLAPHWRGLFAGVQDPVDQRRPKLVQPFFYLAVLIFHMKSEGTQHAFLAKVLLAERDRKTSCQIALAIGGLIAMLARVPRVNAKLVEIIRQPVFGLREQNQIFRNFLSIVFDLIERVRGDNALA